MLVFGFCYCDSDKRQYFSTLSEDFVNENHLARVNLNIILTNNFLLLEDSFFTGIADCLEPGSEDVGPFLERHLKVHFQRYNRLIEEFHHAFNDVNGPALTCHARRSRPRSTEPCLCKPTWCPKFFGSNRARQGLLAGRHVLCPPWCLLERAVAVVAEFAAEATAYALLVLLGAGRGEEEQEVRATPLAP
mmetsp:Transcript_10450/g.16899  ORF Transcript_10450/g.16899 Transcript_10450/m.16899 type:complete len:190 (-) Transcript_10450:92-661(-)